MGKFYLAIWLRWAAAFILIAGTLSIGFATVMTAGSYAFKGFASLDAATFQALGIIWIFWLGIGYGIGMIGGLVGGLKFVCKRCLNGYRLVLLNCQGEALEEMGLKYYFKIWRKWFFALIWVNATLAIVIVVIHKLLFGGSLWMGWFTPWWLTPMIIISGLFAMPISVYRCKSIRIEPCLS